MGFIFISIVEIIPYIVQLKNCNLIPTKISFTVEPSVVEKAIFQNNRKYPALVLTMATVKVFTPNFKHITVKISPNMTLLQVIRKCEVPVIEWCEPYLHFYCPMHSIRSLRKRASRPN